MSDFENLVYKVLVNELALWKNDADEIYAISLMLRNEWDNPMWPRLLFSHNPIKPKNIELEAKLSRKEELEKRFRQPKQNEKENEEEKWNPVGWGGSNGLIIGGSCDEDGTLDIDVDDLSKQVIEIREQWLKSLGLWYSIGDTKGMIEGRATCAVATAVFHLCIRVVQRLHEQGAIYDALGKVVPIIVHEHECDLDSLANTRAANPPNLCKEYEEWLLQGRLVTPDLKWIERWPGEWQFKEQQGI